MQLKSTCFYYLYKDKETNNNIYLVGIMYHYILSRLEYVNALLYEYLEISKMKNYELSACGYFTNHLCIDILPEQISQFTPFPSVRLMDVNVYYTNMRDQFYYMKSPIVYNENIVNILREKIDKSNIFHMNASLEKKIYVMIIYKKNILFTQITKNNIFIFDTDNIIDIFIYGGIKDYSFFEKLKWCCSNKIHIIPPHIQSIRELMNE